MRIAGVAAGLILAILLGYLVLFTGWRGVANPSALQAQRTSSALSAAAADSVELGRLLFFDPRLSGDAATACAVCHIPEQAWADGIPLSAGYSSTLYFRNTPTLLNSSQMPVLYWDGRFAQSDMDSLVRKCSDLRGSE